MTTFRLASSRPFGPSMQVGRRSVALLTSVLVLWLAMPLSADARCQIQTAELPVKLVGSRAVATVGINGTPVPLMVDSGAFYSFLTDAAAAQLKLPLTRNSDVHVQGITGKVDTHVTTVDKVQLLKGEIPSVEFAVGGNEAGAGTMGVMGRNLLGFTDTEYDLAHGVIRFLVPNDDCAESNMAYWAGSSPVTEIDLLSDRSRTPSIRARVKLNGKELIALFDSGATTVVTLQAAKRAGIAEADLVPAGTVHGAGRGSAKAWTANFERFELGGEVVTHNRLQVSDFDLPDIDMLLGIDFFLSHRIYVSKKQSKMFLTYGGGTVFALNKSDANGPVAFDADPAGSGASAAAATATADQYARRGAASAARHDFESALADVNRAIELDPASAAYYAQRGSVQIALKHRVKALEDFDKGLALDPSQADARSGRALLRFQAKDRDGAAADLDALDKTLAPQAQLRLSMASLYLSLDQPAQVIAQLNQWLPAHPNERARHAALNSRCWARMLLGKELDQAISDCDDAIDDDGKNANYFDSRAWVYLRMGRYDKALGDFDRSIALHAQRGWTLYGRGLAKTRMGDAAQGEADIAAARKAEPDIDDKLKRAGLASLL